MKRSRVIATLTLFLFASTAYAAEPLTHKTAPRLSDEELGHLRNFAALAAQPLDDWTGFEGRDQKGMEAYRYQLAFMTYALALQQYHSVPAYRDVYKETIDRLIERMLQKPVWEFWEEVSQIEHSMGMMVAGGKAEKTLPMKRDPVGEKNIMYSGHVIHMATLYEMLYNDKRWARPGALEFRWDENEVYTYDLAQLIDIIHKEMMTTRLEGGMDMGAMECEPNLVFPECNQHPTLAFKLFDDRRGTDYAAKTMPALKSFFERTEMHHPESKHTEAFYIVKEDRVQKLGGFISTSADGWTGAFMHAWDPEYIKEVYAKQHKDFAWHDVETNTAKLPMEPGGAQSLGLGFFANLAAEVGDTATLETLLAIADEHYPSTWDEHGFRFTPTDAKAAFPVNNTTDKLLALARSNRPSGLWKMHNEPWQVGDFFYPTLSHVDFPRVLVRQAIWDREHETLLFTLEPADGPLKTTFRISNIPTNFLSDLLKDGEPFAAIDEHAQAVGDGVTNLGPGEIEFPVQLDGPTQFMLRGYRGSGF